MTTATAALTAREYLRVSVDKSGTECSPEQQHAEHSETAADLGVTLGKLYKDIGYSARCTTHGRPRPAGPAVPPGRWFGVAALGLADQAPQQAGELFEDAVLLPLGEVAVHLGPRDEVVREVAPQPRHDQEGRPDSESPCRSRRAAHRPAPVEDVLLDVAYPSKTAPTSSRSFTTNPLWNGW